MFAVSTEKLTELSIGDCSRFVDGFSSGKSSCEGGGLEDEDTMLDTCVLLQSGTVRGFGLSAKVCVHFSFCLTFVISDQEAVRLCVWFGASIYSDGDMNASGRSV